MTGLFKLEYANVCLDARERESDNGLVRVWTCDDQSHNQRWAYHPDTGRIQNQFGICLDHYISRARAVMWTCHAANPKQRWAFDPEARRIKSVMGACLSATGSTSGSEVRMVPCDDNDPSQRWLRFAAANLSAP